MGKFDENIAGEELLMPTKRICEDCGSKCYSKNKSHYRCKKCFTKYSKEEFEKRYGSRQEYGAEWQRIKKYGIDNSGLDCLWIAFKGKCGICGIDLKMPELRQGQPLNVFTIDHDHKSGKLRGLLCNGCNKGIGLLKEDPNILLKAYKWCGGD